MHAVTMTRKAAEALFHAHRAAKPKGDEFYAAADAEERLAAIMRPVAGPDGRLAFARDPEAPAEWVERFEDSTFRYLESALKTATAGDLFLGGGAPIVVAAMKAMKGAIEEKVEAPRLVEPAKKKGAG